MTLNIRQCTISEIENASNVSEILDEYASESSIKGLPHPFAKADTYKHLESTGAIHVIAAFYFDGLIGFIVIISPILPHYSVRVSVIESFFVLAKFRKTGAGLKLLSEAEKYSKNAGALGALVSAPIGGDLAEVLPHIGYTETNRVFFKGFAE